MRRLALVALLAAAACASPEPDPVPLTPIGERPPEAAEPAPEPAREPQPEPDAEPEPDAVSGPAWIEVEATEDGAPSARVADVLEPLRDAFGVEGVVLAGTLELRYDGAKFFGQVQAHNYHGIFDLVLRLPDGGEARLALKHSWGRLPKNATQAEVAEAFFLDVDQALAAWVFGQPGVQALSDDPEGLAERAEELRHALLERLQGRLPRGQLAQAARSWEG